MVEKEFILVPLDDERAKKIAQAISNKTSRKIISYFSKENASETEIAKELNLPISTIHYNVQALLKAGLVESKKFRYSEKGNKIHYYGLAEKSILISPKGVNVNIVKREIRKILPIAFISLAAAGFIKFFYSKPYEKVETVTKMFGSGGQIASAPTTATTGATEGAAQAVAEPVATNVTTTVITKIPALGTEYAFFFLAGVILALGIYLLLSWRRK